MSPVLKAKVNNAWVPISGGAQEVAVGNTDPLITDPGTLLWFNTTNDQLLAQVNRRWQQVIQGANEVIIGPADPSTLQPGAELWYNTASNPAVLNAKVGGQWKPVFSAPPGGSEVEVADVDPYTTDPASIAEMWYDSSVDPGILYARVGAAWEAVTPPPPPIPNEVVIGGNDPSFDTTTELWYDTTKTPAVLLARVGTTWVPVTAQSLPPGGNPNQYLGKASTADYQVSWQDIPRELPPLGTAGQVLTKTTPANPLGVAWSDTAAAGLLWKGAWDAATAYVVNDVVSYTEALYVCVRDVAAGAAPPTTNRASWVLMVSGAASGGVEVIVSPDQPTDAQTDLWYDEDAVPVLPTAGMRAFWNQAVTYAPEDQVLWPEDGADIYMARRPTLNEEPGVRGVIDSIDFNQTSSTLPQGLSAIVAPTYTGGVDLRVYFRAADSVSFGTVAAGTNAANIAVWRFGFYDTDPADATKPDVWRFEVLDNTAVHVVLEVSAVDGFTSADLITHPFVRLVADAATNTLSMFKSDNGVDWLAVGTPLVSVNPLLLGGVEAIHLAHDNDAFESNWENILCAAETFNYGGVKQTSWWARTQPNVATDKGIGVSPLTGEDYVDVNVCPRGTFTDFTTPWAAVSNMPHWSDEAAPALKLHRDNTTFQIVNFDGTNRRTVTTTAALVADADALYVPLTSYATEIGELRAQIAALRTDVDALRNV